jgi:hypothetical protein
MILATYIPLEDKKYPGLHLGKIPPTGVPDLYCSGTQFRI